MRKILLSTLSILVPLLFSLSPHVSASAIPFEVGAYTKEITFDNLIVGSVQLDIVVSPGEVISRRLNARLRDTDKPMDITVKILDLGERSAKNFISIDNSSFHLEPGKFQDIVATITIPTSISGGGWYATIRVEEDTTNNSGVTGAVAVELPVRITVKNSTLTHEGRITEVRTGNYISGEPIYIYTSFTNSGNHHYKVQGEVSISSPSGEVVDLIHETISLWYSIPTTSRDLVACYIPEKELIPGTYTLKSSVMLEDGTVIDEAEGTFRIGNDYVPPPPPASVAVTPSNASELLTNDERISIKFPQGAFINKADVSLQYYLLDQLPLVPKGYTIATTCFRVDGITGLLAKDATITVKYSSSDLEKANGDPFRLKLARWDEADDSWTILETQTDKKANTLSTKSNRFSIWVIVVAPEASTFRWGFVVGIAVGIILVTCVILLFVLKRRKSSPRLHSKYPS